MMRYKGHYLLIVLLVVAALLAACSSDDDSTEDTSASTLAERYSAEQPLNVLRLDSYHSEYSWSAEISGGVIKAFAEQGLTVEDGNLKLDYFYMDTKRKTDTTHFDAVALEAAAYIRETQPDIVIVSDNNAIRLTLDVINEGEIPFIFCGMNDSPTNYRLVNHENATGVLERTYIEETFDWIEQVFGADTRIMILLDDSITSNVYVRDVHQELEETPFAGTTTVHLINTFEEWQTQILEANTSRDVIVIGTYHTLRDAGGNPVNEDAIIQWTVENAVIPVVPYWGFSIPFGTLGGVVIKGETQGYQAAMLASDVLRGTPINEIEILRPPAGTTVLNEAAAAHWNVTIPDDLRAISEIYAP